MKCNQCQNDAPIQRIAMGNHRFCSGACVVKYAGTNKNVPWLKSEAYQMYYETDFDSNIKDVLSEQDATALCKDTRHQAVPSTAYTVVEAAGDTIGTGSRESMADKGTLVRGAEGSEGRNRENICLCRSGVLDVYKNKFKASGMAKGQEPRQNCADKRCACFNVQPTKTGHKD